MSTPRADPEVVYAPMTWTSLPAMTTPRSSHTATVLADGRVLVAGGLVEAEGDAPTSAEIFDPATSSWTSTGSMTTARTGHNALLLADGRVVVIGGNSPTSGSAAEVWDPSTGEWAAIGGLIPVPRDSAALLSDGRILVAGGSGRTRASLLDLATGTWTQTDHYSEARYNVSLVTLRDGTLLLVGGDHLADRGMALVERYEPSSNGWSVVGSLKPQTHAHSIALLDDGRILAIGSERPSQEFAQLFDPVSGQSTFVNTPLAAWAGGDAVRLPDGRVLFASGEGAGYFDPASESWVSIPPMPDPRSGATMSLLRTSAVLIAGGWTSPDGASTIPSAAVNLLR
ncbi:MAG TPA: kelch repeat-containing protein [Candidatus Limnocylindrales bacterium]|nr:kelch repeat-containing protein [Candidatus Limnocylindrales bacterium]